MNVNIYVIAEPCVGVKEGSCVDVCPVACIHTTPESPQFYIDPDICIACEQCVLVCPVNAIFLDQDLPSEWQHYTQINADFFQDNKPGPQPVPFETALRMLQAVQGYAAEAGIVVAVAVVDEAGEPIAAQGDAPALAAQALNRAFTAARLQVPTDELSGKSAPPDLDGRYAPAPGGIPIVEGPWVLGAIGVAGGATPAQDVQCCRAGLAVLGSVNH
ncbi:MAG TPA: heme-binding protein [Chloroflexota bacterium]|nr:heme-binding protein [Chloroflexota bacterium]